MTDSQDRWRKVDALFDAALDLPPGARAAFLDAHCPPELRRRVEAILDASGRMDTFLPAGAALHGSIARSLSLDEVRAALERARLPLHGLGLTLAGLARRT